MLICPDCQTVNPPKGRYCRSCGRDLRASDTETQSQTIPSGSEAAETPPAIPEPTPAPASQPMAPLPVPAPPGMSLTGPALSQEDTEAGPGLLSEGPELVEAEIYLAMAMNFHRVLVAGYTSTFVIHLENTGPMPLENLDLLLDCSAFGKPVRQQCSRLIPGQSRTYPVEVEPSKAGNFILTCEAQLNCGGQQQAYRGTRSLRINKEPDENIQISIGDIQCNSGGGANVGLGAEGGDVSISNLIAPGAVKSLNDLLDLELPEDFQAIDLDLDYTLSIGARQAFRQQRKSAANIPRAFIGFAQAGQCLRLDPVAAQGGIPPILLVSRPQFRIGRARPEVDFTTWFLPRSSENDQQTKRISKLHVVMELENRSVILRDNETANTTTFNGQDLSQGREIVLDRRGILSLAGSYSLDVMPFLLDPVEAPAISNIRHWTRPGPGALPRTLGGSVRLDPVDQPGVVTQALWLLSEAAFGSSRSNALVLEIPGIAEIQGRFVYHEGAFWLENTHGGDAISCNQHEIHAGEIIPLVTGQSIRLGTQEFRCEVIAA